MRLFVTWLCVIFGLLGAAAFAGTGGSLQEVQIETEGRPVLLGFDPVLLVGGQEAKGQEDITAEHDGYVYAFVSEENRKKFVADPSRYEIQFRGACASMVGQGAGPKSGDADRFHVYKERIYIFASATCREHFQEDPERYVDPLRGENRQEEQTDRDAD